MHIVLVSPGWPMGVPNGIVTYVHHLRAGLLQLGHRVTVIAVKAGAGHRSAQVYQIEPGWATRVEQTLCRVARRQVDALDWAPRLIIDTLRRVHRASPVDIVEMEESFGWFAQVQRGVPMPVVVKLHGPAFLTRVEEAAPSPAVLALIEREAHALRQARYVFAPALDTISRTFDRFNVRDLPLTVIRNPVAAPITSELIWNARDCDPKHVLFVGRFHHIKGGDLVLQTFRRMLDRDPGLRLSFVGPNSERMQFGPRSLSIQECIHDWFGEEFGHAVKVWGPMPPADIQALRCNAAVTVVASRWENQPNTALEAMAQACPVAATPAGGVREVIDNGRTGVLAASADAAKLSEAIFVLLDDLDAAGAMGAAARAYVQEAHDPAKVAQQTVELYRSVLTTHAAPFRS